MTTKLSTKGQVVLPKGIRRRLSLRPGDQFDARVEGEHIILTPRRKRSRKVRIVIDGVTGLPVLTAGPDAPTLTSAQVAEILADFP